MVHKSINPSLTERGWLQADEQMINQKRRVSDIHYYLKIAIHVHLLPTTKGSKTDEEMIYQNSKVIFNLLQLHRNSVFRNIRVFLFETTAKINILCYVMCVSKYRCNWV